jgi:hypothetical protein
MKFNGVEFSIPLIFFNSGKAQGKNSVDWLTTPHYLSAENEEKSATGNRN